ncbi:GNAT family N-acetyltransferase [Paraliomyxa miuraensis]|uniref:GNAT family N-acetyltransferase n=1 Tax=Paraliomyxa miuraensis TaxID=376150 RepID=UPI0022543A4C|nr:GNAT family N-acetyltransferase [Paraliomyxa miuraensis]MCX4245376.1 GNAT family N-acetyltransferase [Paraliomyxa miuraensis]
MPLPLELGTERLVLRRLTSEHLDDLVELDSDPEVMRYIGVTQPNSRERYESELLPRMTAWDDEPYGFLAAYEDRSFVGWFHLRPTVAPDESMLELGYRLRHAVWGRGLATEGGRALIRYAFEDLDQPAVDACVDPRNAASIRVLEKCGMWRVGTFIHPRVPIEVVRYVIERDALAPSPRR